MSIANDLRTLPPLASRRLPSLDALAIGVQRIEDRWPDVMSIPEDRDREKLAREIRHRVAEWDWQKIKTSRIIAAAIAIFDDERSARPDLKGVRDFYVAEIEERQAGSFLDAMVWVYIESFREGAEHSKYLAAALRKRDRDFGARIHDLLKAIPTLFDITVAPSSLAKLMMDATDPFTRLKEIGLRAPHVNGLAMAAHKRYIGQIRPALNMAAARNQLFRWLMPDKGTVLTQSAGEAIEAVLAPWKVKNPSDEERHEMTEAIVKAYGDPRLHRGGIWAGFDPDLKAVILRWLTKQDMKFFCDTVTATQDSHMWPPRRDFWLQLHEDGEIQDAWVAFGSAARRYAQDNLMRAGTDAQGRRFGRQLDRGGSTSLLIMRIGNKIVVDGCHSYRTHIFRDDDPKAPKLYDRTYNCDDIMRAARNSKSHSSIPSWKTWVLQHV